MTAEPDHSPGKLLSLAETANRLSISVRSLRRMLDRRELPHYRIGKQIRVSEPDLAAYIRARRQG